MLNIAINFLRKHIKGNLILYFVVILCFLIGVSIGAFTLKVLSQQQTQELTSYLRSFFQLLNDGQLTSVEILKQSIVNNLQLLFICYLLGISIVGAPFVLGIVVFKGFVLGFTVSLLVQGFKLWGLLMMLFVIFPQNFVIICTFIIASVTSIVFTVNIVKAKFNKSIGFSFVKSLMTYTGIYVIFSSVIVLCSILEGLMIPIFIKITRSLWL